MHQIIVAVVLLCLEIGGAAIGTRPGKENRTKRNETKYNKKRQTGHRAECFGQDTLSRLNVGVVL